MGGGLDVIGTPPPPTPTAATIDKGGGGLRTAVVLALLLVVHLQQGTVEHELPTTLVGDGRPILCLSHFRFTGR